jgi:hypothetical protein
MKEPRRLVDRKSDALAQRLLRSWQDRVPDPGAIERAGVALGMGAAAAVLAPNATLAATGAAVPTKVAASSSIPLLLGKWCAIGIASATVTVGSVHAVRVLSGAAQQTNAPVHASTSHPSREASTRPSHGPSVSHAQPRALAPDVRATQTSHASRQERPCVGASGSERARVGAITRGAR